MTRRTVTRAPDEALGATVRAAAKVNLSLRVIGRRPDGYHLLDSLVVPVGIFDRLTVRVQPARRAAVALRCDAPGLPAGGDNLAVRAAHLFLSRAGVAARVVIDLHKSIPIGAGLGGGSSDAASVLVALNRILACGIPEGDLMRWALELGADVPFFVLGRPARVRGIGEVVEGLESWPRWFLVVAFPGFRLSTADVYRAFDTALTKAQPASSMCALVDGRVPVRELLVNDLEAAAVRIDPRLNLLKQRILRLGALGALMTGSGSAVFGVWEQRDHARAAAARMRAEGTWARVVEILSQVPEVASEPAGT